MRWLASWVMWLTLVAATCLQHKINIKHALSAAVPWPQVMSSWPHLNTDNPGLELSPICGCLGGQLWQCGELRMHVMNVLCTVLQ